ncbi:MAG: hypothetical protein KDB80_12985 [Planctomycetes bacterium]|nr:hypothetical protein [Planctomycetota bacterium]
MASQNPPFAPLVLASLCVAISASAQSGDRSLEDRVRALEQSAQSRGEQDSPSPERRGLTDLGQTTMFDSAFNPAISVIGDFVFAGTDRDDNFERHNQFLLRDVELGFVGRVDPSISYQVYVHFDESDIELEEAFVLADDWLPDTFQLKAGRYNVDFGKLSSVHDHDLPFVDKPQVLQDYLGGSLRGTGLELHHYFEVGDATLVRWSAGIVNGLDGDSHAVFGPAADHDHGDGGVEPFGDRDFANFGYSGRISALADVGESGTLQVGASVAWAPAARAFYESGMTVVSVDLASTIVGADVLYKTLDAETGAGTSIGAELLHADTEHSDDGMAVTKSHAFGFYGYAEQLVNRNWSFGASGGHFQHAEDDAEESWDAGLFVTHRLNEFNRLRVEVRRFDDPVEDSIGLLLQWTVILGSHGHGIDW